ncbi:MAG: DUF1868 domain-containing protein [Pseudomonadota bacterium]
MQPAPFDYTAFSQSYNAEPVRFIGSRLDADGTFLTERGNTVVRHVIPGSNTAAALLEMRAIMQAGPCAHKLAFTAAESLHMTVFNGVIETSRSKDTWPNDIPRDADVRDTTPIINERLEDYVGPGAFNMRTHEITPFGVTLTGATDADEATARAWRDSLPERFGYRSDGHDTYVFHTTMAYLRGWIPDDRLDEVIAFYRALTEDFVARVPVMELGPPCFCSFEDMNWFEPIRVLPGSDVAMPNLSKAIA